MTNILSGLIMLVNVGILGFYCIFESSEPLSNGVFVAGIYVVVFITAEFTNNND